MGDSSVEGVLGGFFGVYVNELVVVCCVGEKVDVFLGDFDLV